MIDSSFYSHGEQREAKNKLERQTKKCSKLLAALLFSKIGSGRRVCWQSWPPPSFTSWPRHSTSSDALSLPAARHAPAPRGPCHLSRPAWPPPQPSHELVPPPDPLPRELPLNRGRKARGPVDQSRMHAQAEVRKGRTHDWKSKN